MLKPRRILPGATLGFVGPSGTVPEPDGVDRAIAAAQELGYRVKVFPSCRAKHGYLSGPDDLRARDVNAAFEDASVDAVVCIRGGYGTPRLLDKLDYPAAARHPKALLGLSDITGFHLAYSAQCGLITLHTPMPMSDWIRVEPDAAISMASMDDLLSGRALNRPLVNPDGCPAPVSLSPGTCEGRLIGGNLALMAALTGTRYMPDLTGAILILEDVHEHLYRVDRMLTQLRLSGAFDACAGIVLGQFTDCEAEYPERSLTLEEIIRETVLPAGKPVLSNLMIGHCRPKLTVALGARYALDAQRLALTLIEDPFVD